MENATYLPARPKLLGSSRKVEKGRKLRVETGVVYLSPSTESGRNLCPKATAGCAAACLGHNSGQLAMPASRRSRLWKSRMFTERRREFLETLARDVRNLEARARRARYVPAVRCDGSSDTGIGARLAPMFPQVQFYDYTKVPARALRAAAGGYSPNYSVTFSRSGENDADVSRVLCAGGGVAVVFAARPARKGRVADPIPETYVDPITGRSFRVIDGDASDARFMDRDTFKLGAREGYVVGLRFKAAADRAGHQVAAGNFVVPVTGPYSVQA